MMDHAPQRPALPGMDTIEAIRVEIERMKTGIKELTAMFPVACREMCLGMADLTEPQRFDLAWWLYWMVAELPVTPIRDALFPHDTIYHFVQRFKGTSPSLPCPCCRRLNVRCNSRTDLMLSAGLRYCDECDGARMTARSAARHAATLTAAPAAGGRVETLRAMPYAEYLQSPEWQARRKQHLQTCSYRCQVCNAGGVILDVHHRTYERRGDELFVDLIVLCRECHELFHARAKLKH